MRTRLKELDDMIGNRLLAEGWDGTAATGYGGSWTDWKKGADMVVDALGESSIGLADAATGYEAQDAAHSRSIQRVTNSLDLPGL